jgi:tetraacyldisaccharide 4'-kinase
VEGVPLLIASIARPEYLVEHVRSRYSKAEVLTYPDHHRFTANDVSTILQRAERCDCILTTEKDMQRLRQTDLFERYDKPVIPLPIRVTVDAEVRTLDDDVLAYVSESTRKLKGEN